MIELKQINVLHGEEMLTSKTLKTISKIFIGDPVTINNKDALLYKHKTGPFLVDFFNNNFSFNDRYGPQFPSRCDYVNEKLNDFAKSDALNCFFTIILSGRFIRNDFECSEIDAAIKSNEFLTQFNSILSYDDYILVKNKSGIVLCHISDEFKCIGHGGFSDVFLQCSTNLVVKKLKEELISNERIRKRFRNEYIITKSLNDIDGVIKVYDFHEDSLSYTMDYVGETLSRMIERDVFSLSERIDIIQSILEIMDKVHSRNIVHRDLSPSNIFINQKKVIIADFGIGKLQNSDSSFKTTQTNGVGHIIYCAPEQLSSLKEGDKSSDVFSLGKLINYILCKNPEDYEHDYKMLTEKATAREAKDRYQDATALLCAFNNRKRYLGVRLNKRIIYEKMLNNRFDEDCESYITDLPAISLCEELISTPSLKNGLLIYMKIDGIHCNNVMNKLLEGYSNVCKTFKDYDVFGDISYTILSGKYDFEGQQVAAIILNYIAATVNRFHAQDQVKAIYNKLPPELQELFDSDLLIR